MERQLPRVSYLYSAELVGQARLDAIRRQLTDLAQLGRFAPSVIQEHREALPTEAIRQTFFDQLREFSARHHVGLGRAFGSNKHRFWYLPSEIALVQEGEVLRGVFPCDIDDRMIDPGEFIECVVRGEAWMTLGDSRRKGPRKHQALVELICRDPDVVEPGARLIRSDVHVSRDFGEIGYIDVVLRDGEERYLLLEVKVKPAETDKAIGQILRHKDLFCTQSLVNPDRVRVGIACPDVTEQARRICGSVGIEVFELRARTALKERGDYAS